MTAIPEEERGDVPTAPGASDDTATAETTTDAASADADTTPDALFPSVTSSDPRVADALSRLDEADRLPLPEQVAVYADIHRRLASVLADPDSQA